MVTAANGRKALERARKNPQLDVILLDLMMPEMDGYQFRAEQQQDPTLSISDRVMTRDGGATWTSGETHRSE